MTACRQMIKTAGWAACVTASVAWICAVTGCTPAATKEPAAARNVPLDFAWNFASSITNNPIDMSDRCLAQKAVVLAYLAEGDVETARACAVTIEDWSRGVSLAAVAEWYASHGEPAKAEAMLPQLDASGFLAHDWQREFLRLAILRVHALLGRGKDVAQSAATFDARSKLGGDVAVNLAVALARTGRVDEATGILAGLSKTNGMNTADSSVKGYLDLITVGKLDPGVVTQVLAKAWAATDFVSPPRSWDLQLQVIDALVKNGYNEGALQYLKDVSPKIVAAAKLPPEVQAAMLCRGAVLWKKLGDPLQGEVLRGEAEKSVERRLELIFKPDAYAKIAEVFAQSGDLAQARIWYNRALDLAITLVNSRPRALAGVDVCVSLAGHKEVIDADIQKRLERLAGTFDARQP
jgi:tetratricopeptide (TPR) repeat protein